MVKPACDDATFIELFEKHGAAETARKIGVNVRNVHARRASLEGKYRRQLVPPDHRTPRTGIEHPHRVCVEIQNGVAIVGSDAHIWPGPTSTALRAFAHFCKELQPQLVVMNGDVIDAATISRHPPIGWEARPTVQQEIEAAQEQLGVIEAAAGKAQKCWTLGNHDARFETRLATAAPEFAKIAGVHLKDHFPLWRAAWSCWVNDDLVIKHRYKGGMGATRANALNAGKSMVTGHLHSLKVTPLTDYNGTRYGVDTGCLADTSAKQFVDYTEDAPLDWRSGFAVLTFHKGRLLWPEVVSVFDKDAVEFRGQIIRV
jgi:hypothetical protein